MYNEPGLILELILSTLGIFIQTLNVKNPFKPTSTEEKLNISLNVSLYYLVMAGSLSVVAGIFLSPLSAVLNPMVTNKTFISIIYIVVVNVVYFLVKLAYPKIVRRRDEEDFLTRFLTQGQRRNNPFDFSNPEDIEKAEYTIEFIIKPSLTAMIYLVFCVILGILLTFVKVIISGKGL